MKRPSIVLVFLTIACILSVAACDSTWGIVVQNETDAPVIAKVVRPDASGADYYPIPAHQRVTVGANGVAGPPINSISILDTACAILLEHALTLEGNSYGGVVTVSAGPAATFVPGNPAAEAVPAPTASACG